MLFVVIITRYGKEEHIFLLVVEPKPVSLKHSEQKITVASEDTE